MVQLAAGNEALRRRALYHATLFFVFSMFWTAVPLLLAGPDFHLSQNGIALFGLAGAAGAISAPIAGRVADRGWTRAATAGAILLTGAGFALTKLVDFGSMESLVILGLAAIVIDFGVQANVVLGFRALFALGAEARSRINAIYMTTFFLAGEFVAPTGGWPYAYGGWTMIAESGMPLPLLSLIYQVTEPDQAPEV